MTFAKTIAVLTVSLMCIHCSDSGSGDAGPNYPGSTENEFSLLFNGVDGHGTAGDISATLGDPVEVFSISIWFKAVDAPAAGATMLHLNPEFQSGRNSMQVRLYWETSNQVAFHITPDFEGDPGAILTADVAEPQEWNHLVLTFDAGAASGNVAMYLNGAAEASGDQGSALIPVGNIVFAREGASKNYFHGYLDEVAFWDSRLGAEEIEAVYNDGTPKNVRFDIPGYESADSVTGLWRMGDENFSGELHDRGWWHLRAGDALARYATQKAIAAPIPRWMSIVEITPRQGRAPSSASEDRRRWHINEGGTLSVGEDIHFDDHRPMDSDCDIEPRKS